jgi:hypothetical protein
MSSGWKSDRGSGERGDAEPTVASASEAMERQLTAALDASASTRTRFHLRQALQLVEALDERE